MTFVAISDLNAMRWGAMTRRRGSRRLRV